MEVRDIPTVVFSLSLVVELEEGTLFSVDESDDVRIKHLVQEVAHSQE